MMKGENWGEDQPSRWNSLAGVRLGLLTGSLFLLVPLLGLFVVYCPSALAADAHLAPGTPIAQPSLSWSEGVATQTWSDPYCPPAIGIPNTDPGQAPGSWSQFLAGALVGTNIQEAAKTVFDDLVEQGWNQYTATAGHPPPGYLSLDHAKAFITGKALSALTDQTFWQGVLQRTWNIAKPTKADYAQFLAHVEDYPSGVASIDCDGKFGWRLFQQNYGSSLWLLDESSGFWGKLLYSSGAATPPANAQYRPIPDQPATYVVTVPAANPRNQYGISLARVVGRLKLSPEARDTHSCSVDESNMETITNQAWQASYDVARNAGGDIPFPPVSAVINRLPAFNGSCSTVPAIYTPWDSGPAVARGAFAISNGAKYLASYTATASAATISRWKRVDSTWLPGETTAGPAFNQAFDDVVPRLAISGDGQTVAGCYMGTPVTGSGFSIEDSRLAGYPARYPEIFHFPTHSVTYPSTGTTDPLRCSSVSLDYAGNTVWYQQSSPQGWFSSSTFSRTDLAPPDVFDFTVHPLNVDTSTTGQTVKLLVGADDDFSGVAQVCIQISTPEAVATGHCTNEPISGSRTHGLFEVPIELPRYSPTGNYLIESITLTDQNGRSRSVSRSSLSAEGYPTSFAQTGPGDTDPPQLTDFTISSPTVDTSVTGANVNFQMGAKDDASGVLRVCVHLTGPAGPLISCATSPVVGNTQNGRFETAVNIAQGSPFGTYAVDRVSLQDAVGRETNIAPQALSAAGFPTSFANLDRTPPNLTITSGPDGLTSAVERFEFDTEPGVDLECSVDQGASAFGPCSTSSSHLLASLTDGSYVFRVRATDPAGNQTERTRSFTLDTAPPETVFTSGPLELSNVTSASFAFTSDDLRATFECRLDSGSFGPCSSPLVESGLTEGLHILLVRAIDPAGNSDPSPASKAFTIDTTPPETNLDPGPATSGAGQPATFTFTSPDSSADFECRIDDDPYSLCVSPRIFSGLANGSHTFTVRAVDRAGNPDLSPATWMFRVETAAAALGLADTVLSDAPTSYWRLGENPGSNVILDQVGNRAGEFKNGAGGSTHQGVAGADDTSARFDGNNSYGYINGIQAPQSAYSMEIWADPDDAESATILQQGGAGALFVSGGRYAFRQVDTTVFASVGPSATGFDHLVGTWDGQTANIYVNGQLRGSIASSKPPSGSGTLYIGYGDVGPWFRGYLDEAAYYSTALSPEKVKAHFDAASTAPVANPVSPPAVTGASNLSGSSLLLTVDTKGVAGRVFVTSPKTVKLKGRTITRGTLIGTGRAGESRSVRIKIGHLALSAIKVGKLKSVRVRVVIPGSKTVSLVRVRRGRIRR